MGRILSMGEILWDVFPDKEFLGGAPLNFSVNTKRLGSEISLVSAVGTDSRGTQALHSMQELGLYTDFIKIVPDTATGTAIVTTDDAGNAHFVIPRPAAFDHLNFDDTEITRIAEMHPDWIYYGTLAQTNQKNEMILQRLAAAIPNLRCFYDVNLRAGSWNFPLVHRLSRLASIIKINDAEAETLFRLSAAIGSFSVEKFCGYWASFYSVKVICVTLGSQGCGIWAGGEFHLFPGYSIKVVDTVGAGDAFSAAFLYGYRLGWPMERTASFANALGALVASRTGATPPWSIEECYRFLDSFPSNT